jgi:sporulation protein YlmC with PRC-barrel domain
MKKTREFKGMPVMTLQEGERLGQVRDLILDPAARQVVALVLDRRAAKEDQVIATANVRNVGAAAITVEDRSSLVPLSRIPRFQELARSRKPIQGKMVISETGARLGQVDDLEVDVQTFRIVSLTLKGTLGHGRVISAELVRTIGSDAIVVRDEAAAGGTPPALAPTYVAPPPAEAPAPSPPPTLSPEGLVPPVEPVAEPIPVEPAPLPPNDVESAPPPDPGAAPGETPAEPAENSWQRWVRRLKNG